MNRCSDIDCISYNGEYYAISSTFQLSPGMVIHRRYKLREFCVEVSIIHEWLQAGLNQMKTQMITAVLTHNGKPDEDMSAGLGLPKMICDLPGR